MADTPSNRYVPPAITIQAGTRPIAVPQPVEARPIPRPQLHKPPPPVKTVPGAPAPVPEADVIDFSVATPSRPSDDLVSVFGGLATQLSGRIERLEKRLASRPAQVKAAVTFQSEERAHTLEWVRLSSDWRFWVFDVPTPDEQVMGSVGEEVLTGTNGRLLMQCTVDIKIAAAEALPKLFAALRNAEVAKIERLKGVLAGLDSLENTKVEGR